MPLYALQGPLVPATAPDALVALLPDEKAYVDSLYIVTLAKIGDGNAKT